MLNSNQNQKVLGVVTYINSMKGYFFCKTENYPEGVFCPFSNKNFDELEKGMEVYLIESINRNTNKPLGKEISSTYFSEEEKDDDVIEKELFAFYQKPIKEIGFKKKLKKSPKHNKMEPQQKKVNWKKFLDGEDYE